MPGVPEVQDDYADARCLGPVTGYGACLRLWLGDTRFQYDGDWHDSSAHVYDFNCPKHFWT